MVRKVQSESKDIRPSYDSPYPPPLHLRSDKGNIDRQTFYRAILTPLIVKTAKPLD